MNKSIILRSLGVIIAMVLFSMGGSALGTNYEPCDIPPVVGVGALPNVMLLMDSSGNMGLPAYFPINTVNADGSITGPDPTNTNQYYDATHVFDGVSTTLNTPADYSGTGPSMFPAYDQRISYSGIFRPEKYYVYNPTGHYFQLTTAANAPVKEYTITSSAKVEEVTFEYTSGGTSYVQTTNFISFTVNGSITDIAVGDLVSFSGLDSHSCLNGYTYEVTAKSGSSFTVAVKVTRTHKVGGADVAELVIPGPAGLQWWRPGMDPVTPPTGCSWNGKGDSRGVVAKRISRGMDFLTKGVSGSVLNFVTTSRLDAGLVALIGGREDYPTVSGDDYAYIKALGSRWFVEESTNFNAGLYVRPAQLKDCAGNVKKYPDDFSTKCATGDTSFQTKTSFLTVFGKYSSYLDGNDPVIWDEPAEGWKFTLDFAANVKITLQFDPSTWPADKGARLQIYSNQSWGTTVAVPQQVVSGNKVSISVDLNPGTYYVRVAPADSTSSVWLTSSQAAYKYTLFANVPLVADTVKHTEKGKLASYHQGWDGGTIQMPVPDTGGASVTWTSSDTPAAPRTNIGAIPFADVRVAIPNTVANPVWQKVRFGTTGCDLAESTVNGNQPLPACPRGLVQDSFNMVRFGFAFFSSFPIPGGNKDFKGKILIGFDNRNLQYLLYAIQGIGVGGTVPWSTVQDDFSNVFPYGSPPTGPALDVMVNYFQQQNNSKGADNSTFTLNAGTAKDPYYDAAAKPVPCRKSFIILVSTGANSDSPDPTLAASHMHDRDLRTTTPEDVLKGTQDVKIYTIYAFASDPAQCDTNPDFKNAICGRRAMKTMSAWGGYSNLAACGSTNADKPHGFTSTPPNGTDIFWPLCSDKGCCDPTGTYDEPCCREWNKVWDRDGDQIYESKGIPDNYYEASDGKQLQSALMKILFEIVSVNAAASAVATVSQEIKSGDVIVRGAFRAADPETLNKFLWFGHLESFWPDAAMGGKYDFEYSCNRGLLCYEMPGPAFLGTPGDCPSSRRPYCWDGASFLKEWTAPREYRTIFTGIDSNNDGKIAIDQSTGTPEQIDVTTGNATQLEPLLKLNVAMNDSNANGAIDSTDVETFIDWVRGIDHTFYRSRVDTENNPWQLGDLVYSTPVVSGTPSLGAVSPKECTNCFASEYWTYRNLVYSRQTFDRTAIPANIKDCVKQMVYVGANDGMIHAFVLAVYDWKKDKWIFERDTGDDYAQFIGEELWAYMPSNMLSELKHLASSTTYGQSSATGSCAHRTMVDLSPHVWQVYMKSDCKLRDAEGKEVTYKNPSDTGKCWRSVLIGGERGGGDVYFAIDVSDPDYPKLLWEHSVLKDMVAYNGSTKKFSSAFTPDEYDDLKILPLTWSKPSVGRISLPSSVTFYTGAPNASTGAADGAFSFTGPRHVAFIGGGFRVFDTHFDASSGTARDISRLLKPSFLAIDIETGQNLFRYVWPYLLNGAAKNASSFYADYARDAGTNTYVPYAMSDPLVLDLWNQNVNDTGDDGLHDHIYVGDLHGNFYAMKFHLGTSTGKQGIWMDIRRTRDPKDPNNIASGQYSFFRSGTAQPITVPPVASADADFTKKVRVIFGTGKYDNIEGGVSSDKEDVPKMSLYNMLDTIKLDESLPLTSTYDFGGEIIDGSGFYVYGKLLCNATAFDNRSCTWRTSSGEADDCSPSTSPCWDCVFDLTLPATTTPLSPGERVVNKALIAGGLVFVTTYIPPSNACNYAGNSFLYIFDYMCKNSTAIDFNKVLGGATPSQSWNSTVASQTQTFGVQLSLGSGMASMPILDTSGENVIIQLSDASLLKLPVTLPTKRTQSKGWVER